MFSTSSVTPFAAQSYGCAFFCLCVGPISHHCLQFTRSRQPRASAGPKKEFERSRTRLLAVGSVQLRVDAVFSQLGAFNCELMPSSHSWARSTLSCWRLLRVGCVQLRVDAVFSELGASNCELMPSSHSWTRSTLSCWRLLTVGCAQLRDDRIFSNLPGKLLN